MKVHLMFKDRDFDSQAEPYLDAETLSADLELDRILDQMANRDQIIRAVCTTALFHPLQSEEGIRYRQEAVRDAIKNPDTVRELYAITQEAEKNRMNAWYWLSPNDSIGRNFSDAVGLLRLYTDMLARLRSIADEKKPDFQSEGFLNLFNLFQRELSDAYLEEIRSQLDDLKGDDGILISVGLGSNLQGVSYVLRRKNKKHFWRRWKFSPSFTLAPRDDAGIEDLARRRDRAIQEATNALAQSAEHVKNFSFLLREELAFYVGCLNLADRLQNLKMPVCIPDLLPIESRNRSWEMLYDVSLALTKNTAVVGNCLHAENKGLYMITGANQGGKSTFLRSIGQAQLMAQCGMFVGAVRFAAPIRLNIYTHFKKEEDASMKSGKLDEELGRMDALADHLQRGSLMLFNESFASTNEREGSEINRQITKALTDNGVEVFSVTHLYTFATAFLQDDGTEYLRAQRLKDGSRTFEIKPGKPLRTAFGEDLYRKIFR